jgi:hypothetical protein
MYLVVDGDTIPLFDKPRCKAVHKHVLMIGQVTVGIGFLKKIPIQMVGAELLCEEVDCQVIIIQSLIRTGLGSHIRFHGFSTLACGVDLEYRSTKYQVEAYKPYIKNLNDERRGSGSHSNHVFRWRREDCDAFL